MCIKKPHGTNMLNVKQQLQGSYNVNLDNKVDSMVPDHVELYIWEWGSGKVLHPIYLDHLHIFPRFCYSLHKVKISIVIAAKFSL